MTAKTDGLDHINVYSKGKTQLGRLLSNFSYSPINIEDGYFASIESYWYWLLCSHPEKDRLRKSWGFDSKKLGRELGAKDWPSPYELSSFQDKIKRAIKSKIHSSKTLESELTRSVLPIEHYYVYGNKIVNVKEAKWIIDYIDSERAELKSLTTLSR